MTLAHSDRLTSTVVSDTAPFFADGSRDRVVRYSHHRRPLPSSQMFLVKMGLEAFRERYPSRPVFDASQGDGGATIGSIPTQELADALVRFLPKVRATSYGTPQGDVRVRTAILENFYGFGSDSGLTPHHVVLTDGGRDALQKWYQASALMTGIAGECLLTSAAPWISYGHGAYLTGMNLLCAPISGGSFKITPDGVTRSIVLANQQDYRVRCLVITTPDNPTGTFYTQEDLIELIEHASGSGIRSILVDLMYQMILDPGLARYNLPAILRALSPEARRRVVFMDGLTKSAGASNVRHAHLVCGDLKFAQCVTAIASHTVLPNVLGEAAAFEVYGSSRPDRHLWIRPVVELTARSRALFRARMRGLDHSSVCDQGYYAFVHVAPWLKRDLPHELVFEDAHGRRVERIEDSNDLSCFLTNRFGIAVVPGTPFYQPDFIRFSLANTPDYTAGAVARFDEALRTLT